MTRRAMLRLVRYPMRLDKKCPHQEYVAVMTEEVERVEVGIARVQMKSSVVHAREVKYVARE